MRRAPLAFAIAAVAAASSPAGAQTIVVGVGAQLTGRAPGKVRVPVYADLRAAPGVRLGSYTMRIAWDPTVLYYESVDEGTFGLPVAVTDSAYYGVLRIGGLSAGGVEGLVDLFAVNFGIYSDQTTPVTLTVTEAVAAGSFADLTPQVTVVPGLYCPAVGRWGDLDGDGQANSRDALAILSAIVGLPVDPAFTIALGDVDADGLVNSRDALITLSHAVGLAVPGQRVLVYAPGAGCAAAGSMGLVILPDTVDVAVGQVVRLLLAGTADGVPAGTTPQWTVADPDIAVVGTGGVLSARAPGTSVVTASVGPGIAASVPVIVRARRGVWHVDAARAVLASVQLGTQEYPFSTPQYVFPIAQEGDTIRVAPGVHDYLGDDFCTGEGGGGDAPPAADGPPLAPPPDQCSRYGYVTRGVVLLGDTLADGTRPVLRGNPDARSAVEVDQGAWADIRHLVLRNFEYPVSTIGVGRHLRLDNVRIEGVRYGSAIDAYGDGLDSLVLRDVEIIGNPESDNLIDINGVGLAIIDGLTATGYYGINLYSADSVEIRNSDIRTRYQALYVSGFGYSTWTAGRVYLGDNRFEVDEDQVVSLSGVLRVTSERNVYVGGDVTGYDILNVDGVTDPPIPGSRLVMTRDSVIRRQSAGYYSYAMLYANDLDTIRLDSVISVVPDSGTYSYGTSLYGNTVQVFRSVFPNQGGYPLYAGGRDVTISGSVFTGCRVDCGTPYGIELLANGDSIARAEITGNTFLRLYRAIAVQAGSNAHRVVVTGNTIDSVDQGISLYGDSLTVTDNVITRAFQFGLAVSASTSDPRPWGLVQRNRVFMAGTGGEALEWGYGDLTSQGNYYAGTYFGVYLTNSSDARSFALVGDTILADAALSGYAAYVTGRWNATVRRSRFEGGYYGFAFQGSGGSGLTLDSTVIRGTTGYAAQLYSDAATSISGRWNNVTANAGYGVQVLGGGTVALTDGRFVGNGNYAIQATSATVNATNNWWGNANGPGGGVADSVAGAQVTWAPPLGVDPLGSTVPASPPGALRAADPPRAPLGRLGARHPAAPAPKPAMSRAELMAERAARREANLRYAREHRAEAERRRQQRPSQ